MRIRFTCYHITLPDGTSADKASEPLVPGDILKFKVRFLSMDRILTNLSLMGDGRVFKPLIKETVLILSLAVAAALTVNALRAKGLDWLAPAPPAVETAAAADRHEIPLEEAVRRHAEKSAVFADARPAADYAAGHIQGALSLPDQEFDTWAENFIAATDPETVIITYCEGAHCLLSKSLAEKLIDLGYVNTRYLIDGWGRWKANRLPIGKGDEKGN
jgi:rhodanese-related sulfurtransferase